MTIEADLFFVRRRGPVPLLETDSIEANGIKKFSYSRLAKVLVICDQDGNGGGVFIKNPNKDIGVTFYESEEDEMGKDIDPRKPIRLRKGQEVVIWSEKTRKELNIYIDDDDGDGLSIAPPQITVNS